MNRGFIDEHLGAVASTIPVKRLIKNGTPYPMASPKRYRRSVLLLPLKKGLFVALEIRLFCSLMKLKEKLSPYLISILISLPITAMKPKDTR